VFACTEPRSVHPARLGPVGEPRPPVLGFAGEVPTRSESAIHQLRPYLTAPSPFLSSLHSNPFDSSDCALFSATATSQPFAYQSLTHSFHRDGGGPPLAASWILFTPSRSGEGPLITHHCSSFLCFHTLAHSFALFCTSAKLNSFVFKRFRTLWQKYPGVGSTTIPARSALCEEGRREISGRTKVRPYTRQPYTIEEGARRSGLASARLMLELVHE